MTLYNICLSQIYQHVDDQLKSPLLLHSMIFLHKHYRKSNEHPQSEQLANTTDEIYHTEKTT